MKNHILTSGNALVKYLIKNLGKKILKNLR